MVLPFLLALAAAGTASAIVLPPAGARFDYQLGGDYPLPRGVHVVARDWFSGRAPKPGYGICYINGYQTQADDPNVDRPDERSRWPTALVLSRLGDDPNWGGEYLIDISTAAKRVAATNHVRPMIARCRQKGFRAVEFDNLDSWTRFDGTPLKKQVPFGKAEAVDYAKRLVGVAHRNGLAAAQKNTVELGRKISRGTIGFDFAVSESCAHWTECDGYRAVFGALVFDIEYSDKDLAAACVVGINAIRRDRNLTRPETSDYRFASC